MSMFSHWTALFKDSSRANRVDNLLAKFRTSEALARALNSGRGEDKYWEPAPLASREATCVNDEAAMRHIKTLKLPYLQFKEDPDAPISLDSLGSFSGDDVLKARMNDLFVGRNTLLVNSSGSGKTRLLHEGLCERWGLIINSGLWYRPGFIKHIHSDGDETRNTTISNNNLHLADVEFSTLLLIRLLAFKDFLHTSATKLSPGDGDYSPEHEDRPLEDGHRRKIWLQVQLRYPCGYDFDYGALYEEFKALPVEEVLTVVGEGIAQTLEEIFSDPDVKGGPLIWRKYLEGYNVVFVAAGTSIPAEHFTESAEWDNWRLSSNTG
ncbi:hypothetical protein AAF712_014336, partial [Marasmius tenuissimus]